MKINEWAKEDRPREKMERLGAEALSNAELLAILIGSGTPNESAVELMQKVLSQSNNNLNTLGKKSIKELMAFKGVGPAKAITILAACELGKRRQQELAEERLRLDSSQGIYQLMRPTLQDLDAEEAWLLLLNQQCKLIKKMRLSHGGLTQTMVDVRILVREALLANATLIVLCHNHPSGSLHPSREDDHLTERVKKACDLMSLHFIDHLIITDGAYYSYRDEGRL
ncbi:MAG: DNA repair protein RadC [Prevotella sp.]|nr:DNA repair protein RadC [Prevotella sp.]MCI5854931.1 DNA repair protein RadC [Prevotella sp.]MDD6737663.1 DNA repair protein RadC [Prevotella sp.]MDY6092432.1 DNA repair protein RadC [Prevotella sp.]